MILEAYSRYMIMWPLVYEDYVTMILLTIVAAKIHPDSRSRGSGQRRQLSSQRILHGGMRGHQQNNKAGHRLPYRDHMMGPTREASVYSMHVLWAYQRPRVSQHGRIKECTLNLYGDPKYEL